jgi:heme exporter protein A
VDGAAQPARVTLEARGLAHRYGIGRGLAAIDFDVASPGVAAVTGPNGSGKSTLMRILAGLLRPSAGDVRVRVGDTEKPAAARRLWVGFASPDVAFYEEMTVAENLGFAAAARGTEDSDGAVRAAIERVGLVDRAADRVGALSSGLKQRVRLAFALLGRPSLLLLDEPGSHLDEPGRIRLERLVMEKRADMLVVIATNDEREWRLADKRIDLAGHLGGPA